jgi:hypothetical protein
MRDGCDVLEITMIVQVKNEQDLIQVCDALRLLEASVPAKKEWKPARPDPLAQESFPISLRL